MALALYRKYRPRTFAEIIGQEHVTEPLSQALRTGRLHHAYLFSGPRGCGKTSSARILARSLNCVKGPTPDPCGECDSCRALAPDGAGSIDVIEIDAASHGGVDDARDLRERAFFAPVSSRYKIYVIDEAHMVSSAGFNALLKLVEEPPDYVKFVFATTEPEKVLGTIKSRTHHYPFRLIPPGVLRPYLESLCAAEGVTVQPAVFPLVVRAGAGSVRDTLSVLDQLISGAGEEGVTYARAVALLGVTDAALIDEMCDALAAGDGAAAYATIDRVAEAGHDPRRFAGDLLERLRDLIVLQQVPDAVAKGLLAGADDELERMAAQAERFGPATLSRMADIVHTGLTDMRGTTAPRLVLELITARMLLPGAEESTAALLQRMERMERRLTLSAGDTASAAPIPAVRGGAGPAPADTEPPAVAPPAPARSTSASSRRAASAEGTGAPSEAEPDPPEPPTRPSRTGSAGPKPAAIGGAATTGTATTGAATTGAATTSAATTGTATTGTATTGAATPGTAPTGAAIGGAATTGTATTGTATTGTATTGTATTGTATPGAAKSSATTNGAPPTGSTAGADTPIPGAIDAAAVRRIWDEVLTIVRRKSPRAAAVVREATVRDVDGDTLVLSFKHQFHAQAVAADPDLLVDAVYEVLGGRWQIRCEIAGEAGATLPPTGGGSGRGQSPPRQAPSGPAPATRSAPPPAAARGSAREPGSPAASGGAPDSGDDDDWPTPAPLGGSTATTAAPTAVASPPATQPRTTQPRTTEPPAGQSIAGQPSAGQSSAEAPAVPAAHRPNQRSAPSGRASRASSGRPAAPPAEPGTARAAARAAASGKGAKAAPTGARDDNWAEEPPYDPEYDGPIRPAYEGFDPGDEPDDEVDAATARQTSEQQALELLRNALGAEKIGEGDA